MEIVNEVLQWVFMVGAVFWLLPRTGPYAKHDEIMLEASRFKYDIGKLKEEKLDKPPIHMGGKHEFGHDYD